MACGEPSVTRVSDSGPTVDSGSELDLRFRGVGQLLTLVSSSELGGGPLPGSPASQDRHLGREFAEGLFVADLFLSFRVTFDGAPELQADVISAGFGCADLLATEMERGATILGIGGDVTSNSGTCTMTATGPTDGGSGAQYATGRADLDALRKLYGEAQGSSVVTALTELDAGDYAYVSESRDGGQASFETVFLTTGVTGLAQSVGDLVDGGFVITAGTGGPSGFTLVAVRPAGGLPRKSSLSLVKNGVDPIESVQLLLNAGLAPVAIMLLSQTDGGFVVGTVGQN